MMYQPVGDQVIGQSHILREAFAPTGDLAVRPPSAPPPTGALPTFEIHILLVSMDGGDVTSDDRPRVRVSLVADSDDWGGDERSGGGVNLGSARVAVSGVGVVEEDCAICRWGRRQGEDGGTAVSALLGDKSGAGSLNENC